MDSTVPQKPSTIGSWIFTLLSASVVALVGTFSYRLGAAYNIPYGLILALMLVGLSCFLAGARVEARATLWHEFVHALVSAVVVWAMALSSTTTSTVVAMGGKALVTFWSQHASLFWLYGIILVQLLVMFLPREWVEKFGDHASESARA
ncbi:alcohol dehydrogenase [Alloscardovia criceti]|uniref:alcohol dehydrogenase n=1 Tax=Alloscardovia criceti TaxID=356828 RepID=UPI0012EA284D|nr:alcohol dehydrogenase [Alloscardovia criceti]